MILLAIGGVSAVGFTLGVYALGVFLAAGWHRYKTAGLWGWRSIIARRPHTAKMHRACGVYVQWCGPVPFYVGQTVNLPARFYEHAQTIRSIPWTHWTFLACPEVELDGLERSLIHAYPWTRWFGFNRTDGNEK